MGWMKDDGPPDDGREDGRVVCAQCGASHDPHDAHPELANPDEWAFGPRGIILACSSCPRCRQLVNLTPHAIVLRGADGDTTVPPSGAVARVGSCPGQARAVPGCPVLIQDPPAWGEVEGLPKPLSGTMYIVSGMVGARCPERRDVVSPGTGPADGAIRDDAGRIVAVTRLVAAKRR